MCPVVPFTRHDDDVGDVEVRCGTSSAALDSAGHVYEQYRVSSRSGDGGIAQPHGSSCRDHRLHFRPTPGSRDVEQKVE